MASLEFARKPKPGATIQVIGAGLGRTGTNSFCAAMAILLDGPAYHAGVQWANDSDESHILTLIDAVEKRPYRNEAEKQRVLSNLASRLDGFVTTGDPPLPQLLPELMEIYPDAKVICTIRDAKSWAKSTGQIVKMFKPRLFWFLFYWLPSLRYVYRLCDCLTKIHIERYGVQIVDEQSALLVHERHMAWVREVVPPEKLFIVNVQDGWEPLCKALDLPVPKVPFPRLNESAMTEAVFRKQCIRGLLGWAVAGGVFGLGVVSVATFWRRLEG